MSKDAMRLVMEMSKVETRVKGLLGTLQRDLARVVVSRLCDEYSAWARTAATAATKASVLTGSLREHPGMSIDGLALAIYGESSTITRSRVRSMLSRQLKAGTVERYGYGKWRVTDE